MGKDVLRHPDCPEKRSCIQQSQPGKHYAQQPCKGHGAVNRPAHSLTLSGPEVLGNHHSRAGGQAHEEPHQHIDDRGRSPHRRQGVGINKISYHIGIHCIVQLLEKIPYQKRD